MAAGRLAAPGTQYGPCNEKCGHVDCAQTREMAETICHYCNESIGYDTRFYSSGEDLVHAACLEEFVEQER
jgi:hypothetical protein